MEKEPILVFGAGSWGTALALVLATNRHKVYLWGRDSNHIAELKAKRCNQRYMPDIELSELITPIDHLNNIHQLIKHIIIATPCSALDHVLSLISEHYQQSNLQICLVCKGFAKSSTQVLNHSVVTDKLPNSQVLVLSGPSFAKEVACQQPTAVTLAAQAIVIAQSFQTILHNEYFRIYTHDDIIGAEVGGAVKNVMAIATGLANGLGFGANTHALILTRGLAEIKRLGLALGGKLDTFIGLSGVGDLMMTASDDQSRNRRFGLALAQGHTVPDALKIVEQVVEGVDTAAATWALAQAHHIEMPISEQIYHVIHHNKLPKDAVQELLLRLPRTELD